MPGATQLHLSHPQIHIVLVPGALPPTPLPPTAHTAGSHALSSHPYTPSHIQCYHMQMSHSHSSRETSSDFQDQGDNSQSLAHRKCLITSLHTQ